MIKNSMVVQSNRLIEARYRLTIEEQKIIKILISQIQRDDTDFQVYTFHVKELGEMLGITHKQQYAVLNRVTDRLLTRILKFYNPETKELLKTTWLSSARYKEKQGTISFRFDPELKPLLLQLKSYFTQYTLEQVMQFKGQYAIRFFEFRKSFLGRGKNEAIFSLKELWEILGLGEDEYTIFRNFRNRVLEPARLELLERTGKSFTWEPVKQGRGGKIVGVRLVFDSDDEALTDSEAAQESPPSAALDAKRDEEVAAEAGSAARQAAFAEIVRLGVAEKAARDILDRYPVDQIQQKLALVEQRQHIKNQAGFFIQAMQGDWCDPEIEHAQRQTEKRQRRESLEVRKREVRRLKDRFAAYRVEAARTQYQEAPEALAQQWRDEFVEHQPVWKSLLRGKKLDFEHAAFRAFVMERLPLPALDDFLEQEHLQLSDEDRALWNAV